MLREGVKQIQKVVVLLFVALACAGCAVKDDEPRLLTTEEAKIVKRYDALPESVKSALKEADIAGMTVASKNGGPLVSRAMQAIIEAGAKRTSITGADFIVESKVTPGHYGNYVWVIVRDKQGNCLSESSYSTVNAVQFNMRAVDREIQRMSRALGLERRRQALAK
jgi:hypothetical protein